MLLFFIRMMTVFPAISLSSPLYLKGKKGANDSISMLRHKSEFSQLVSEFEKQVPLAFVKELHDLILDQFYQHLIAIDIGYLIHVMTEIILLLFWCHHDQAIIDQRINKYKSIIQQWPDAAKLRFQGEQGWEKSIRLLMSMDRLQKKFKMSC